MSTSTLERKGPHSPDALAVPGIQSKRAGGSGIVETDEDTGLVTAIVSVTGVRDEVDDIIMPGAYKVSLQKRTPKGVWSHDWNLWTAKTESVEEILPGDPRLPSITRAGKTWPKEAGVLLVKARFNLETQQGREAFSNVRFFADECEWSIGYTVLPGKSARDAQGVRMIKQIELFEFSPVLFGAMPLAGTLAVKSRKAAQVVDEDEDADLSEAEVRALFAAAAPEVDWDIVDAATASIESKAGGADRNRGNADRLRRYWTTGAGGQRIRWGVDGDFDRCVAELTEHLGVRAKGYCNLRHQEAVGAPPGQGAHAGAKAHDAEHRPASDYLKCKRCSGTSVEFDDDKPKCAKCGLASVLKDNIKGLSVGTHPLLAEWQPGAESGPSGASAPPSGVGLAGDSLTPSVKAYPHLAGSEEERRAAIDKAVSARLMEWDRDNLDRFGKPGAASGGSPTKPSATSEDGHCWVSIDGTFADRVIATVVRYDKHDTSDRRTFRMTYVVTDDLEVVLGEPEPVELVVAVDVADAETDLREQGGTAEYGDAVAMAGKALDVLREGKAGRVLSTMNEQRLRAAVENLVTVLRAAGVTVGEPDVTVDMVDPETTAEAATGGETVGVKSVALSGDRVSLNPADVFALSLSLDAAVAAADE